MFWFFFLRGFMCLFLGMLLPLRCLFLNNCFLLRLLGSLLLSRWLNRLFIVVWGFMGGVRFASSFLFGWFWVWSLRRLRLLFCIRLFITLHNSKINLILYLSIFFKNKYIIMDFFSININLIKILILYFFTIVLCTLSDYTNN